MKRIVDLLFASFMLIPLAPLFLLIGWIIRLESPGPIFYRGIRSGVGGRLFRIYKFRTMVLNAEKVGGACTSDVDPRITRVGAKLRKYKLDEFPQFLNVFVGEMSVVGPRPEVPHYTAMFTDEEKAVLSVRPGITDLASLWNSDEGALFVGQADPEKYYVEHIRPQKIRLQLEYVRKRNLLMDVSIICRTAGVVLKRMASIVNRRRRKGGE